MSKTIIATVGKADLEEEIIFTSEKAVYMGDLVDLKVTKPEDAPVYGQARVTGYEQWNAHRPIKFKAIRVL